MGDPSHVQLGLSKFAEGLFGGLAKERSAADAEKQKAAYLQAMMDRAELQNRSREYTADEYGKTRLGVAADASKAKIEAARIAAEAAKKRVGMRPPAGAQFDTSKALQEAMRAAGDPRASGKVTGLEDFGEYTPEKASAFNAAYRTASQAHNSAYPDSPTSMDDYLVETQKASEEPGMLWGKNLKPARYGVNPKRSVGVAKPKSAGAARLEALGIQASPDDLQPPPAP